MAHDFLGNELSIGDDVVFLNYNVTSASLERGKITRVSEHTAEISGIRRAEYKIIKVNPVKPTMDNTWIPCSERLPDLPDGEWAYRTVIVCVRGHAFPLSYEREKVRGKTVERWKWTWNRIYEKPDSITHWMPLPEPPEEDLQDEKN